MMSSYEKLCSGRQLREKHRQKRNEMLKSVIIVPFPPTYKDQGHHKVSSKSSFFFSSLSREISSNPIYEKD